MEERRNEIETIKVKKKPTEIGKKNTRLKNTRLKNTKSPYVKKDTKNKERTWKCKNIQHKKYKRYGKIQRQKYNNTKIQLKENE